MAESSGVKDEFGFIHRVRSKFNSYQSNVLVANGDDAAVYRPTSSNWGQVLCVDTMVEDVHFSHRTMSTADIGYKSVAVNLSDIAAMGGIARYFLVSLAIPSTWSEKKLDGIYDGMRDIAAQWGIDLLGGDVVHSPKGLILSITAIGEVEQNVRLLRSNAQPGDKVLVTGPLGGSAAGLSAMFTYGIEYVRTHYPTLSGFHQRPIPHLQQGRILARFAQEHAIALNDISDGLASEALEIAQASHVDVVLNRENLPLHRETISFAAAEDHDPIEWALYGGEDFMLVLTVPPEAVSSVQAAFKQEKLSLHPIGSVQEGRGRVLLNDKGNVQEITESGYNHFRY